MIASNATVGVTEQVNVSESVPCVVAFTPHALHDAIDVGDAPTNTVLVVVTPVAVLVQVFDDQSVVAIVNVTVL